MKDWKPEPTIIFCGQADQSLEQRALKRFDIFSPIAFVTTFGLCPAVASAMSPIIHTKETRAWQVWKFLWVSGSCFFSLWRMSVGPCPSPDAWFHVGLHHSSSHTSGVSFKATSWLRSSEYASVAKHFSSPWPVRLWALVLPTTFNCWRTGAEMAHNVPLPVFSMSQVSPWSPRLQMTLDFLSQHTLGTHLTFADNGSSS